MLRNLIIPFLAFALFAAACKKTEPCEAIITVQDTLGNPLAGIKVVIRQDSVRSPKNVQSNIFQENFTGSSGEAVFEVKWEAVLNVEVYYDTTTVRDYIRLEQSETVRKTVTVR